MNRKDFTPAQKIAKESTISFAGMGYGKLIQYLFTALLARLVGVQYLGIYALGSSITSIAKVLGKAGTDVGIMRYVSMRNTKTEQDLIKQDIRSALKIGLVFSIIMMIVQIVLSKWLTENIFNGTSLLNTTLIVYALSIPFTSIMMIALFATQGFQLLKYKIFVEYILNPTVLLVSTLLVYLFFSSELAIIFPTLLTGMVGFLIANYLLKKVVGISITNIGKIDLDKKILAFSFPIMFTMIIGTLLHWMDIIMLGYFTNTETVGLYHPAIRTAGLQQTILIAFAGIFSPMFSRYFAQSDYLGMNRIYKLVSRWIITMALPILILIILFPKKIMLLFGADFIQSADVLIVLSIGTTLFTIFGISSRILLVSGRQMINLLNAIIAVILNIILNIVLIPQYGMMGAAIATLAAMCVIAFARIIETYIYLRITPFNVKYLKPMLAGIVTYISILFIKPQLMDFHTIITIILAVTIIFILYTILLIILKIDNDDKDFLQSLSFLKNKVRFTSNRK